MKLFVIGSWLTPDPVPLNLAKSDWRKIQRRLVIGGDVLAVHWSLFSWREAFWLVISFAAPDWSAFWSGGLWLVLAAPGDWLSRRWLVVGILLLVVGQEDLVSWIWLDICFPRRIGVCLFACLFVCWKRLDCFGNVS